MAAPYNPPVKGEDFITGIALEDAESPGQLRVNPTIEAGDFVVSKDFGATTNLTTLPSVLPAGGRQVKLTVSATEMNADNVGIIGHDPDGEWSDFYLSIPTTA